MAKTVASIEEVGVSLCLGFRLSGSDGRESENYELEGEKRVKKVRERTNAFYVWSLREEVFSDGALTNFMLSAE